MKVSKPIARSRTGPSGRRLVALASAAGTVTALSVALPAAVAHAALPSGCDQTGQTVTCSYTYTGAEQTFTVPAGVTSVQVTAIGAAGGSSFLNASVGGQGAIVTGTLTGLTPGATLYAEVGGTPTGSGCPQAAACVGGFNGGGSSRFGGGGGGASDVRTSPAAQAGSLSTRLIVAAGGGGGGEAGGDECDSSGTPGGNAGAAGGTSDCAGIGISTGGGAGTQTSGGSAGTPDGQPGTLGAGGDGGLGQGGGGGGGLYGGGGGGETVTSGSSGVAITAAGGGGGGSSLVPAGGTASLTSDPASITISYNVPVTDNDLSITAPANIATDATGPSGAVVSYPSPVVTDGDDASPPAPSCTPASGTVFAIGTTTVNCTAADPDDSNSPVSASFTVTVTGASGQLASLGQAVQGVGPGNSLPDKVTTAQSYLADGDTADACGTLTGFINEVSAQSGKKIPAGQAAQLIADAQQIQAVLAC